MRKKEGQKETNKSMGTEPKETRHRAQTVEFLITRHQTNRLTKTGGKLNRDDWGNTSG